MNTTQFNGAKRIVITGMGTINPIGYNVPEFWDNLIKGKNGIRLVKNTDVSESQVKIGGEVDLPEDTREYFPKKMIKRLERFILFGQIAATEAYRNSGIQQEDVDKNPERYGVIIGTGDAGSLGHYKACRKIDEFGMDMLSPFYVVGVIPNTTSGFFAKSGNFQGPNFSVNSACATSNHAIGTAVALMKSGMADVIIAGGAESVMNEAGLAGFNAIGALSRRNDDPTTASRPFDKDREGFILSEGSGVLCLEELEHAKKRGAKIYAELTGYGFTCDAYDLVAPEPTGRGAAKAIQNAIKDAGLNPFDIDLVNAHGTSTPLGDKTESNTILKVFGDTSVPVHSTKSMIGHMVGAAGGAEAIASILAIEKGIIHRSINVFEQDPEIKINVVKDELLEKPVKHVLSNSFGFGGQNSSIVLSKFTD